ncbi:hypothetical protein ABT404_25750 [Streptomyces hyaluromycini]|uniref:Uncharacterized protein n=1 Tax=Streptomyces hyaluromycini TaxID=1377993 RepID=A0ABV1X1E4_9ACTN
MVTIHRTSLSPTVPGSSRAPVSVWSAYGPRNFEALVWRAEVIASAGSCCRLAGLVRVQDGLGDGEQGARVLEGRGRDADGYGWPVRNEEPEQFAGVTALMPGAAGDQPACPAWRRARS